MNKTIIYTAFLSFVGSSFLNSCDTKEMEMKDTEEFSLNFTTQINDEEWTSDLSRRLSKTRAGESSVTAAYYLFDSDGNLVDMKTMNKANQTAGLTAKGSGTYTIYTLTNMKAADAVKISSESQSISFPSGVRDVASGKETVTIDKKVSAVPVTIHAKHMLSKFSFVVKNVPGDVMSMSVSIPHLYTSLSLDGNHYGDSVQNISFTKGSEANTDGTYDWHIDEAIVQPYALSDEKMQMTIIANSKLATVTKQKKSNKVLKPGVFLSISTSYDTNSGVIGGTEIDDWDKVEDADTDFGGSTISPARQYENTNALVLSQGTDDSGKTTLTLLSTVPVFGTLSQLQADDAFSSCKLSGYPNAVWRIPEVSLWSTFLHWVSDGNTTASQMDVLMQGIGGIPLDGTRAYLFLNDRKGNGTLQYTTGWSVINADATEGTVYGVYPVTTITASSESDDNIAM